MNTQLSVPSGQRESQDLQSSGRSEPMMTSAANSAARPMVPAVAGASESNNPSNPQLPNASRPMSTAAAPSSTHSSQRPGWAEGGLVVELAAWAFLCFALWARLTNASNTGLAASTMTATPAAHAGGSGIWILVAMLGVMGVRVILAEYRLGRLADKSAADRRCREFQFTQGKEPR